MLCTTPSSYLGEVYIFLGTHVDTIKMKTKRIGIRQLYDAKVKIELSIATVLEP